MPTEDVVYMLLIAKQDAMDAAMLAIAAAGVTGIVGCRQRGPTDAVADAIAFERERCVKLAEDADTPWD